MIELYTWYTPNGRKVSIALEELALPYRVHPIDIRNGVQRSEEFRRLNANAKVPAIVDRETGTVLSESGAILLYLAEKAGRLLPTEDGARWKAMAWLAWQMGELGPTLDQHLHFNHHLCGVSAYAATRFAAEAERLYGVLDTRLADAPFLAGEYSVADVAVWPWVARYPWAQIDLRSYPNLERWYRAIAKRPAVQRGWRVPRNAEEIPMPPVRARRPDIQRPDAQRPDAQRPDARRPDARRPAVASQVRA